MQQTAHKRNEEKEETMQEKHEEGFIQRQGMNFVHCTMYTLLHLQFTPEG